MPFSFKNLYLIKCAIFIGMSWGLFHGQNCHSFQKIDLHKENHFYKNGINWKSIESEINTLENEINIETCNLVKWSKNNRYALSDYWAQNLIGADLLKMELNDLAYSKDTNSILIFDTEKNNHKFHVRNLISDKGLHSVLPELPSLIPIIDAGYPRQLQAKPRSDSLLVNVSMKISFYWRTVLENFPKSSLFIVSIGNKYPEFDNLLVAGFTSKKNTINVGSLSVYGFASRFSQESKLVDILAPSDNDIKTSNQFDQPILFGGTSGAAPLVTGSLAGFKWLSDYHPSPKEARILLEKTALPTVHQFENPRRNGVGVVNAYKLGMVGKRLKEMCMHQHAKCFKNKILQEDTYDFEVDDDLQPLLHRAFPTCSLSPDKKINKKKICENKKIAFTKLRQSLLLNPKRKDLWKILSCIYKQARLNQEAQILDNMAMSLESEEVLKQKLQDTFQVAQTVLNVDIGRMMKVKEETAWYVSVLKKMSKHEDVIVRIKILRSLSYMKNKKAAREIAISMQDDPNPIIQDLAFKFIYSKDSFLSHLFDLFD